jgi:1-acyl-sn-glycerol-3-phosphate acyltransferase
MLRSIAYVITLVVLTIWCAGMAVVAGLFRVKYHPGGVYDRAGRIWANGILKVSGVEVNTLGFESVPDGPVVFVANHQSLFDILALISILVGRVRFVAKKELAKVPLFGQALRAAGHIYIDRQKRQAAFEAYETAAKEIRAGMSAVIFAEGTRSRTGEMLPFKKGPFVLALASQVPVVPVYCAHTFGILPKGSIRIHPRPITLYFGEQIPTEGMDYDDRGKLLVLTREVIERFEAAAKLESNQDETT